VLVALGRTWRNGRFAAGEQFLAMDAPLRVDEAATGGVNTAPVSVTIPQTGMGGFIETPSFDLGINDP
jgi:hypothetical protein